MSESTYFVRHLLPTNASIAEGIEDFQKSKKPAWDFKYGKDELSLHDDSKGLIVDALVTAPNLDEAIKKAKSASENIASEIILSTGEMVEGGQFLFGYDSTENQSGRDFQQEFISPMLGERILNHINPEQFQEIVKANDSTTHNPEIIRALMFLRTSMKDNLNEIMRFSNLWQGLEVINDKLMDEFKVPENERWNTCNNCNCRTTPKMSVGIQKLFNNNTTFKNIRSLRGNLMHGTATFDYALVDECAEKNKILREKLLEGMVLLLGLPEDLRDKLIQTKRRPLTPQMRFVIKAKLLGFVPQPLIHINQHPHYEMSKLEIKQTGSNNKQVSSQIQLKRVCDASTKFTKIETFTWSYDGSENVIKNVEVKLT